VSDIWDSAKLPAGMGYRGDVRREPAIIDHQPIGPWRGRVRVTPLLGVRDAPVFEVSVQWEAGPPLLVFAEHWDPAVDPRQAASDVVALDELELARAVALEAEDHLRDGVRFDLQHLARRRRRRRMGGAQKMAEDLLRDGPIQ
jgi:hypothetical protein